MTEPFIVCPTHGRAGEVLTLRVIPDLPLCVAESQLPLYRAAYPDQEYIVHPDTVVGISPKRQWLMDRYGDVFMIDDDIIGLHDMTVPQGERSRVTDPQKVRDVVIRAFDQAAQMGAYLVGFSPYAEPTLFRPHLPFKLVGFISGHSIGFRRGSKLWFPDTTALATDDLYISAMNAFHHRFMLQDLRYSFVNKDTWERVGGMATTRTMVKLERNAEWMKELFGDAVDLKRAGRYELTHELQLTLKVPW
jgi:hypothetical protein